MTTRRYNNLYSVFIALMCLFIFSCTVTPNVYTEFDTNQDFSQYATFTWAYDNPMLVDGDYVVSPFIGERAQAAIKSSLIQKGIRFTPDIETADLAIAFTIGARDKIKIRTEPRIINRGREIGRIIWEPMMVSVETPVQYTEGVLAIDIYNAKSGAALWHGVGTKKLSKAQIRGQGEGTEEAIQTILGEFPPKSK